MRSVRRASSRAPSFVPDDRPIPLTPDAGDGPRWPTVALAIALVGLVVSLVVTVAWTPVAGWACLGFFLASFGLYLVHGAVAFRWDSRSTPGVAPIRVTTERRVGGSIAVLAAGEST
jgi:hypothetical protein